MFRFAQHDSIVNGFAGIGGLLRPAFGQSLRWRQSLPRLLSEADSLSQIAAATNFSCSGLHPGNHQECFLRPVFSSAADDTRWRTDEPHRECAEAIATQASPSEVAKAMPGPVGKSPRVPWPGL